MSKTRLVNACQVDPIALDMLLRRSYDSNKCDFLLAHGSWWYGSEKNRFVIKEKEEIAGYCAFIPARIWLDRKVMSAIWWVDLVINPPFRGSGYQTIFDEKIKSIAEIKLGFPNKLAATIHKKHKWHVRDDVKIQLCALYPSRIPALRQISGPLNVLIKLFLLLLTPIYRAYLWLATSIYHTRRGYFLKKPDTSLLAGIFERNKPQNMVTTYRDSVWFQRRYLDAPYFNELAFYLIGPRSTPTHYLIARHLPSRQGRPPVTRILDLFGDFGDRAAIINLFNLVKTDAFQRNSVQITMMATSPELKWLAIRSGFWLSSSTRFCWIAPLNAQKQGLGSRIYWVLGDSDNDEPG